MGKFRFHNTYFTAFLLTTFILCATLSFRPVSKNAANDLYIKFYKQQVTALMSSNKDLSKMINRETVFDETGRRNLKEKIKDSRLKMKAIDFWLRYLEPTAYHKINGPLPVEWETEVFEKFEAPYRRDGAGLTLAELYLDEKEINRDSLFTLINVSLKTMDTYLADSITKNLQQYHHFFLSNRLFLLNLASIYTTGFECPDTANIIPELEAMMQSVSQIYNAFGESFPNYRLSKNYLDLYSQAQVFVKGQSMNPHEFDHYHFIKDYVNPLFRMNQQMIRDYQVVSNSFNDFSLNDNSVSIFDKSLYKGQNEKGIYLPVDDEATLNEIRQVGKLLFYDPILSGNNKRSCASCHKPTEYFTDTTGSTSLQFDNQQPLTRNTLSLINVVHNHLVMMDGKHTSLMNQAKDVVTNKIEMGGNSNEILNNVLSCKDYEKAFKRFVKLTPNSKKLSIDHILSAVVLYYSSFSNYYAAFDDAMNEQKALPENSMKGFNLFMGKAQCGTCHFVPQFNGVKPPFISSEFEVLGVPSDTNYTRISADSGRSMVNPVAEMVHAFRTGTVRNSNHTKPYMHNGIFNSMEAVIDFYDAGGGKGKGINIPNQTLSSDSLKLTKKEKGQLLDFISSLDEKIPFELPPAQLPVSGNKSLHNRKVGGEY